MNSSNRIVSCLLAGLVSGALVAAPAPVASGFPVWQGVTDGNHVAGRRLCPSDLRDKVVVVVEFEAKDAAQQLKASLGLANRIRVDGISSYYDFKMPADLVVVCSNRGVRDDDKITAAIKKNDAAAVMKICGTPIYNGLTLADGPVAEGGYPFFYVLGAQEGKVLFKGPVNAKNVAEAGKIIKSAQKDLPAWQPFVGRDPETKTAKTVQKAVAAGKPLTQVYKALLSSIKSKDPRVAREAQQAYDALERTRSDLAHLIPGEARKSPACAFRDYDVLTKFWPAEKARLSETYKAMTAVKEGPVLGRHYARLLELSKDQPSASAQAARARDLKKMSAELERMKDSSNINVQNDAHYLLRLVAALE